MKSDTDNKALIENQLKKGWPLVQDWMFRKESLPHYVGLTLKKPDQVRVSQKNKVC